MLAAGSVVFSGPMLTDKPLNDYRLCWALACLLLGIYSLVYIPRIDSADGEAILAVTASTLRHGVPDIGVMGASDSLQPFDMSRMGTFGQDGAYYSKKGVTPSVALLPLALLAKLLPWLDTRATAMWFNPLVTTATAIGLFTFARWLGFRERTGFVLALIYGIATFAIVYVKTLFGEPLAALLLLAAVMAAYRYRHGGGWRALMIAGLCAGLLAGVNMVYVAIIPVLAIYLFLHWPVTWRMLRPLSAYSLPVMGILALLGVYNWVRFGSPLDTGYHFASGEGFTKPLLEGIYGLTLGPYRGLFWYAPVLLLALPGWLLLRRALPRLAWLILALAVLQIVAFAAWWSWDGGIVWGPRFVLTVTPLFALCLAPLVEAAWMKHRIMLALAGLTALSLAIQVLGAAYSLYPYIGYLYRHYYVPELPGLSSIVQSEVGLSPILGHLALALNRWPLEPAWAAGGVDVIHLLAGAALITLGLSITRSWIAHRQIGIAAAAMMIVCLNIVTVRQDNTHSAADARALEAVLQPPGMVVAATIDFGEALVDVDNGSWVISTNAPTAPDHRLTTGLWDYAIGKGGPLWLVTWFTAADPANWQERDLWERGAFAYERAVEGHRALLFHLSPPLPEHDGGYRFDAIRLDSYGIRQTADGLLVTVAWSAERDVQANLSWFVHVLDAAGSVLAQQDRPPSGGYAPTSGWRAGETQVVDHLYFPDIAGDGLTLRIGWVNPASGELLPAFDPDGGFLPDRFVLLPVD